MSQAIEAPLYQNAVRQQLDRILSHALFARSERMGRFLRLAVEYTLNGRGADLKEYLIGVEVFDRGPSYDSRVDPIVRVEARRLRAKLKAFYDGDGCEDPVTIEFATGSYMPRIQVRASRPAAREPVISADTIAVLPFADLSAGRGNEYFSDGLTEELIHALTKLPDIRVVAWNTAAKLRGQQEDLAALRDQLHAGTVLTGSVRIAGQDLRVRAQLIQTSTGVYLWSETFDRQMADVFAIQEEIACAIVRTLQVQLGAAAPMAMRSRTTISSYDWYLKGRYLWHRRTPEELQQSVKCFENAVAADPHSALAYAGLADAFSLLVDYGLMHPSEGIPRAKAAAERSIGIDPQLAEPHASLAIIRSLHDWEWDDAERLYRRAIALNPGYATAHHWLGVDFLAILGNFEEALREIEIAAQLDPLSSIIREGRGYILMMLKRYDEALVAFREICALEPSFYKGYTSMGRCYAQMGRYEEALAMLERGVGLAGDIPNVISAIGQVHALVGNPGRARELLAELHAQARTRYITPNCFAIIHIGLGEHDKALDFLEQGLRQHDMPMANLKTHPLYDPLRSNPRFESILCAMNLG